MFRASDDDYSDLLHRLSPRGRLWDSLPAGLQDLYDGIGGVLASVHNRVLDVLLEANPLTADEMLDQWLAAYGLPEPGSVLPASREDRRALLIAKLTTRRGQSVARMLAICSACGATASVDEWFDAGRPHTWRLVLGSDCIRFRCGVSKCGEKLVDFTDVGAAVRSQIDRAKPAHTIVEYWDV